MGNGLRVMELVEDAQSNATFLPIYPWPATSVEGQFSIYLTLILHPNPVPPAISNNLVVTLEETLSLIETGVDLMWKVLLAFMNVPCIKRDI